MSQLVKEIDETKHYLEQKGIKEVDFGLILGSGLGELADDITEAIKIPYEDIPHFPVSTVKGHAGMLVYGKLEGKRVLALQGRFHYYEGNKMAVVTYPVRLMACLNVKGILVTNAAGGVNETFKPGDLMLITDHINFMSSNPLIGENEESFGPRFPDMSHAYTTSYQEIAKKTAKTLAIELKEGVYMGFSGPTYETPAEVKMARVLGADAVGMSTVPEVIVASHSGLNVLGISCITNLAAGMQHSLNHEEVVQTTTRVKETFKRLVKGCLKNI